MVLSSYLNIKKKVLGDVMLVASPIICSIAHWKIFILYSLFDFFTISNLNFFAYCSVEVWLDFLQSQRISRKTRTQSIGLCTSNSKDLQYSCKSDVTGPLKTEGFVERFPHKLNYCALKSQGIHRKIHTQKIELCP